MSWIFDPLRRGAYGLILADPAWPYDMRSEAGAVRDRTMAGRGRLGAEEPSSQ